MNLSDYIPLPCHACAPLKVASAVLALHRAGVLHGELCPENVLLVLPSGSRGCPAADAAWGRLSSHASSSANNSGALQSLLPAENGKGSSFSGRSGPPAAWGSYLHASPAFLRPPSSSSNHQGLSILMASTPTRCPVTAAWCGLEVWVRPVESQSPFLLS